MARLILLALLAATTVALAQNRNRQFGISPGVVSTLVGRNQGQYSGGNNGRYQHSYDGHYQHSGDGGYVHDHSGNYVHDHSGNYNGENGQYNHDNSGQYTHAGTGVYDDKNGRYDHDGSGAHKGQNDNYKGNNFGSKFGKGSGSVGVQASATGVGTGSFKKPPVVGNFGTGSGKYGTGSGISPAAGFGKPVAGKQGDATGKYDNRNYRIIRQEGDVSEDGYHYLYETENGIYGEEQGKLANRGTDAEAMHAHGYFTYTGPDSIVYTVRYTADENGFVPQGDHLPTPPPIPEAILRSLEYQRSVGKL